MMQRNISGPDHLAHMLANLPPPLGIFKTPRAKFEVYRAKDIYVASWNGNILREIVALCRMSYARYGNRPLFDVYDRKAAIYLVRATYQSLRFGKIEEWLSLRMVPGDKRPTGIAEPEICEKAGRGIDYWMKKKIGAKNFWNRVASSSRMCGIHPYAVLKNGRIVFLKNEAHQQTPVCFALMHKQFILDYPLSHFPYRYITAMIRPDYYKKGLTYSARGRSIRPIFTPAYRFLGMRRKEIGVKREIYSYEFPLYWFDIKKLLALVNNLRSKRREKPLSRLTQDMFSGLRKKTKQEVPIAGFRIEPGKMRELIDRFVPDGPELKITEAGRWYRSMDALLMAAKLRSLK